jgi:glycosyltransferase involved in cell wall biosynthesis
MNNLSATPSLNAEATCPCAREHSALRVLHAVAGLHDDVGGPATSVIGLCAALCEAGVDASIFTPAGRKPTLSANGSDITIVESATQGGSPIERLFAGRFRRSFLEHCRHHRPDIIHVHGLWSPEVHAACRIARQLRIPYIITLHGTLEPWAMTQRAVKKRVALAL